VIQLPESQNPLALWKSLETKYPNSKQVGEAVYQRGLYFQNRRQFSKALDEYRRLLAKFPDHPRAKSAKKQIEVIEHPDVLLGGTGFYPSGAQPKLWFACRNTDEVEFTVREFRNQDYLRERAEKGEWYGIGYSDWHHWSSKDPLKGYEGRVVKRWTQRVPKSDQVASHSTTAPVSKTGGYLVEARVPGGKTVSKGLVMLTDVAIVGKGLADKVLMWVVDARNGQPLKNQKVELYHRRWNTRSLKSETLTTDNNGVIKVVPQNEADQWALAVTEQGGVAFCDVGHTSFQQFEQVQPAAFGLTDRPLYRPGSRVRFKIWSRELIKREYGPAKAGIKLQVTINSVDVFDTVKSFELTTDESGSVSGSFELNSELPLGEYSIDVQYPEFGFTDEACRFRIEEYKKPEFAVTVTPGTKAARLGDT
ncbi:MAG: hypothetical protein KDA84_30555, partial [Planctomycetaceae bacterium]|nr:hypothetical protein [Planctomycetaceae bacterium]